MLRNQGEDLHQFGEEPPAPQRPLFTLQHPIIKLTINAGACAGGAFVAVDFGLQGGSLLATFVGAALTALSAPGVLTQAKLVMRLLRGNNDDAGIEAPAIVLAMNNTEQSLAEQQDQMHNEITEESTTVGEGATLNSSNARPESKNTDDEEEEFGFDTDSEEGEPGLHTDEGTEFGFNTDGQGIHHTATTPLQKTTTNLSK
jgi:hypothetical protein